jgi:hypothetical protein
VRARSLWTLRRLASLILASNSSEGGCSKGVNLAGRGSPVRATINWSGVPTFRPRLPARTVAASTGSGDHRTTAGPTSW